MYIVPENVKSVLYFDFFSTAVASDFLDSLSCAAEKTKDKLNFCRLSGHLVSDA